MKIMKKFKDLNPGESFVMGGKLYNKLKECEIRATPFDAYCVDDKELVLVPYDQMIDTRALEIYKKMQTASDRAWMNYYVPYKANK